MEKSNFVKIENISMGLLILDLRAVTRDKIIKMKAGEAATIKDIEYEYLTTSHRSLFNHDIKTLNVPENVEMVETEHEYTDEEINKIVSMPQTKYKAAIEKIDSLDVLKVIRMKSVDEGKTSKFIDVLDAHIKELADGVVLI